MFVDDFLITGKDQNLIDWLAVKLNEIFGIRDLGTCRKFVGIELEYKNKSIHLHQRTYIKELIKTYRLADADPVKSPMEAGLKIEKPIYDSKYERKVRGILGSLAYIARGTRPDINFAVNYLSRFQHCANSEIYAYALRILKYLKSTINHSLIYKKRNNIDVNYPLKVFVDSDHGSDRSDRKSTSGVIVQMYGNTIDWYVRKQESVATSSVEAEYVALSLSGKITLGYKNLLDNFEINVNTVPIYCDSNGAITNANTNNSTRMKHVDIAYHHIRDLVNKKYIYVFKIAGTEQLADILTKATSLQIFAKHCRVMFELN